jgi:hypothetical protein
MEITVDLVHHKHYSEMVGRNPQWAMTKIKAGKWTEGQEYFRDPEGRIWVSIKGVEKWLTQASGQWAQESRLDSHGMVSGTAQRGLKNQHKQISRRPVVYALT